MITMTIWISLSWECGKYGQQLLFWNVLVLQLLPADQHWWMGLLSLIISDEVIAFIYLVKLDFLYLYPTFPLFLAFPLCFRFLKLGEMQLIGEKGWGWKRWDWRPSHGCVGSSVVSGSRSRKKDPHLQWEGCVWSES